MGPAWGLVSLRGNLWLPLLCVIFSQVCRSHAPPGWRFTSSEVVVPRKASPKWRAAETQGQLSYKIPFRGQRHVLHLKIKRNIIPRHFPVLTNNDQGAMQEDYPFVPRDCYYYSYLEGIPGSMGTLDTCSGGLRGMLQVDDLTYEIKPLEASSRFEHLISLLVTEETSGIENCGIEDGTNQAFGEAMPPAAPRAGPVYLWWPHPKYLKLHYSVSKSLYSHRKNITATVEDIVILNSIVDTIYRQILLSVSIRILCIWNNRNSFEYLAYRDAELAANEFGLWKQRKVYHYFPHDASILLTTEKIGGHGYYAFQNGACNPNWGASFLFMPRKHIFEGGTLTAHVLCHLVGCTHDSSGCRCFRRSSCLMSPITGLHDILSNCTFHQLHRRIRDWDPCMSERNVPYYNFPYETLRCGDKIIGKTEECDCGSLKECAADKCCETTCRLSVGSVCDLGGCCRKCKYAPPGMICRDKLGICDLPEYCDGKKAACPPDVYIQDGTPCSPLAVCIKGNCTDRDMQCQALFGYKIKDGSPACYTQLNVRGDRFGNCGVRIQRGGSEPFQCEEDDVYCGLLHCSNVRELPGIGEHVTFSQIKIKHINEEVCFGLDAHHGTEVPLMGLVVDGATCAPGSYCKNQNCTFYQDLGFDCDVKNCSFRGVCNNLRHCHCLRGWSPPACAEKGIGGSVDSGPPPSKEFRVRGAVIATVNMAFALLILRSIFLVLAIVIGFFSQIHVEPTEVLRTFQDVKYLK